jgi:hypothetical protein
MAVPAYATDLANVTTADSGTFTEFTGMASGGTPSAETDYYVQGTACSSALGYTKTGLCSFAFDYGSGITVPTDGAVLFWHWFGCPTSLDTYANGGQRAVIGSALADWKAWITGGVNDPPMPYGGWKNVAVDPTVGNDYSNGTPTATLQWFGVAVNLAIGVSRGNVHAMDAIRYGRCEIRATSGDVTTPATFTGLAQFNDYNDATNGYNRYGLFQAVGGGYLWKGLMSLGLSGTAVYFVDANKNITIDNTRKVGANFNKVEVNNVSSVVQWTGISIAALGTVAKGRFEMVANADVDLVSCTFTDMDTFVFQSNALVNGTTFRRCGQVTIGGGTFSSCTFDQSTASSAVLASSPANAALITSTEFTSDGTGHAIEITGTAADMGLSGNIFTGYAAYVEGGTSTGNEAIFVNIGSGTMTISISGGGSTPSYKTAGATVTIASSVTITLTGLKNPSEVRVFNAGTQTERSGTGAESVTDGDHAFSVPSGTAVDIVILSLGYQNMRILNYSTTASASIPVSQVIDRQYSNPA